MKRPFALVTGLSTMLCAQVTAPSPQPNKPDALHELSTSLETLSRRVSRAVVQIFSTGYVVGGEEGEGTNASLITRQRSSGSGVILRADGYIVTNAHVVQGARRIRVQMPISRQEVRAKRSILKPEGKILDA